jgi:hypothetical protein
MARDAPARQGGAAEQGDFRVETADRMRLAGVDPSSRTVAVGAARRQSNQRGKAVIRLAAALAAALAIPTTGAFAQSSMGSSTTTTPMSQPADSGSTSTGGSSGAPMGTAGSTVPSVAGSPPPYAGGTPPSVRPTPIPASPSVTPTPLPSAPGTRRAD